MTRNDDNNVRIGDTYELFYWDMDWVSYSLFFQQIPVCPNPIQPNHLLKFQMRKMSTDLNQKQQNGYNEDSYFVLQNQ